MLGCLVASGLVLGVLGACGGDGSAFSDEQRSVTTDEDVPVTIKLFESDSGLSLIKVSVSDPGHRVSIVDGTSILVIPAANFFGTFDVMYAVLDPQSEPQGTETTGFVKVTVQPIDDAPDAPDSTIEVHGKTQVVLSATDVDSDQLSYEIIAEPMHGRLDGAPPILDYVPDPGFVGVDTIGWTVSDHRVASTAMVHLKVFPPSAPFATDATVALSEDLLGVVTLQGYDPNNDPVTFAVVTPPVHGTLAGTPPNLIYHPDPNFFGDDSLQFSVSNGALASTGTISITVLPVNDPPVATPQTLAATEDTPLPIALTGSDIDGDVLIATSRSSRSRPTWSPATATARRTSSATTG
jgi:hypothetical protein